MHNTSIIILIMFAQKVTVQLGNNTNTKWAYPTIMDGYLNTFEVPSELGNETTHTIAQEDRWLYVSTMSFLS
jgi:hypothetical protein